MKKNILIILLLVSHISIAQRHRHRIFDGSKRKIGFITGTGGQNLQLLLSHINENDAQLIKASLTSKGIDPNQARLRVAYNYHVLFLQGQYYYSLFRGQAWGLEVLWQPQFNLTRYRHIDNVANEIRGFEFGLNLGILVRKNFFRDFLSLYAFVGTGPHFVSNTPTRQSSGFILSDNFFIGCNIRLTKDIYLDIRPGIRHITNSGIRHPNGGDNDFVISGGILIPL